MDRCCKLCKYGSSHDYVEGNYYCNKNVFSYDRPMVHNCSEFEVDEWMYNFYYKPQKSDNNVSKELVYEELKKILFGIKLKSVDEIMKELNSFKYEVDSYREPNKCETCVVNECELYARGCRNCSRWK